MYSYAKMTIFDKQVLGKTIGFKIEFLTTNLNDSAWFCIEKLKKHSFETKKRKL